MKYRLLFTYLLIIAFSFSLISCGGGRKNVDEDFFDLNSGGQTSESREKEDKSDVEDLEALLGISREKPKKQEKKDKQEEGSEILTLLGADEGKGKKIEDMQPLKEPVQDPRMAKLSNDNKSLRSKLKNKDNQIQSLQNEVASLQEQLDSKQSQPVTAYTPSPSGYPDYSTGSSTVTNFDDYKMQYDQALAMFNDRNYEGAVRAFENLLKADTQNSLSDNVQYWIGESHYQTRQYKQALLDFEKVFTFPKSNKNDYAQYKIAMCYVRMGNKARAREELERFIINYPKSPIMNKAQDLLNRI